MSYLCLGAVLIGLAILWYFFSRVGKQRSAESFQQEILKKQELFKDLKVRHVFTHISKVEYIDINWAFEKILETVLNSKYSRFPVVSGSIDNPEGTLLAKDFLKALVQGNSDINIEKLCIRPIFIHLDQSLSKTLRKMLRTRTHLFFVIDNYGCVDGIITLEDILEKLVGEIYDEKDTEDDVVLVTSSGEIIFPKDALIGDVFSKLELELEEDLEPVTMLGWLKDKLARELNPGESVEIDLSSDTVPFLTPTRLVVSLSEDGEAIHIKKLD